MSDQLFIRIRGNVKGPLTAEQIRVQAHRGRFGRHNEISEDGINWSRASSRPDLFPASAQPKVRKKQEVEVVSETETEDQLSESYELAEISDNEQKNWYYSQGSERQGPVSFSELQSLASAGKLKPNDYVCQEGMQDWELSSDIPGLYSTPQIVTQPIVEAAGVNQVGESEFTRTAPMAVASLVLGLVGFNIIFLLGSILAVIFGHVALKQIKQAGGRLSGRGMAIAGLLLGYGVIFVCLIVIVVLAIFMLIGIMAASS
ncbi:GYF domain-containing protein [Gimesia maris]|uniref:GYF domain-containing protein n=1 Tax=Gimesia maris TaxID=122 RepID=A0ABX5YKL2_9PLAN|nr:GYF domain-containing protein [Gimesia maris]EDL57503.1 hypothetical protein PM8797T_02359 [Gimesia maris DSM 8797]QDU16174.1 hypothetical protein CA11_40030 [Gimesia maris]QEG16093.1 hypothetical protein GmarT_19540 [Gimesia maris]QGQ30663.1 DUF4339 domain-containing protein [Gimesia maris]